MTEFTQDELAALGELMGMRDIQITDKSVSHPFGKYRGQEERIEQRLQHFAADVLTKLVEVGVAPMIVADGGVSTCHLATAPITAQADTWPLAVLKAAAHYQLAKRKVMP